MPPKAKITKADIINRALEIVRQQGAGALNARTVAAALNCSTQPLFSNFENMEQLQQAVLRHANDLCNDFIRREVESKKFPEYKASGMGYIRFAKEEKELFKLLFMRDRTKESYQEADELSDKMNTLVEHNTGLTGHSAQLFHLEMWASVHGIAVMLATGFLDLEWDLISTMLTDAYMGMRKHYGME